MRIRASRSAHHEREEEEVKVKVKALGGHPNSELAIIPPSA